MKRIKISILSWLLHHANRNVKTPEFYGVKNKLLAKYGVHIGYDVQFIQGKKCHSCGGTGIYTGYYWESGQKWTDTCNNCWGGWYKRNTWNILQRLQFGNYIFHQPKERVYKKPAITSGNVIDGYVYHDTSKHGNFAHFVLMVIYTKGHFKKWAKTFGNGYYFHWWRPYNFANNIVHFFKKGKGAYPIQQLRAWYDKESQLPHKIEYRINWYAIQGFDELPF